MQRRPQERKRLPQPKRPLQLSRPQRQSRLHQQRRLRQQKRRLQLSPPQQQEAQHRIDAFSRSVAAEMAPIIGMMANPNPNP